MITRRSQPPGQWRRVPGFLASIDVGVTHCCHRCTVSLFPMSQGSEEDRTHRLLIIDRHVLVGQGISALFRASGEVTSMATVAGHAVRCAENFLPNVAMVDVSATPRVSGAGSRTSGAGTSGAGTSGAGASGAGASGQGRPGRGAAGRGAPGGGCQAPSTASRSRRTASAISGAPKI